MAQRNLPGEPSPLGLARALAAGFGALVLVTACDEARSQGSAPEAATPPAETTTAAPAPDPPRAPEIVIDATSVSVGTNRLATGELGLADKLAVFLTGRPMVEGNAVGFVAMRNAKPSQVASVVAALRKAKASSAVVGTEARDGTTQRVPLSFTTAVPDCTTVAWIAKDAAIDVWPAGGGTAKRIIKGLAGPDMTLGTEAMRKQWTGCGASELVVGADDVLSWGLVFDLATAATQAAGTHPTTAVLVTNVTPGRKLTLE
ncbi:MAG TPA: hypothetical protein VGL81_32580 [Polyangiaceae bacterium]|jgi:hypothetical protein